MHLHGPGAQQCNSRTVKLASYYAFFITIKPMTSIQSLPPQICQYPFFLHKKDAPRMKSLKTSYLSPQRSKLIFSAQSVEANNDCRCHLPVARHEQTPADAFLWSSPHTPHFTGSIQAATRRLSNQLLRVLVLSLSEPIEWLLGRAFSSGGLYQCLPRQYQK